MFNNWSYILSIIIEHQKALARRFLKKLKAIDPCSVLAGGAPRDWFLGKPASDLDFYVHCKDDESQIVERLEALDIDFEFLRPTSKSKESSSSEGYLYNNKINAVVNVLYEYQPPIQIIFMKCDTIEAVSSFSLSLSQIIWEPKTDTFDTSVGDFILSVERKEIYKVNPLFSDEATYIEKILNKFPEYKLVGL